VAQDSRTAKTPAATRVRAILQESCVVCHNGKQAAANLKLDTFEGISMGGASGAVVVAGRPSDSLLFQRITTSERALRMPPAGAVVPPADIAVIKAWIEAGADGLTIGARQIVTDGDFRRDVEPVFRSFCYGCHSGPTPKAGLRLDAEAPAMRGGVGGPVITPGDSARSRLIQRIEGVGGEPRMPLGRTPLSAHQIAMLRAWIDQGAKWPAGSANASVEKHWAYQKPVRPAVPRVDGEIFNPIDNFILTRLRAENLSFSPPASKEKLLRRVSLDLTGLPPTPEEVASFVSDSRPDAYEREVDRLLASPHFGERWARPWLDYARYADTNGYEADKRRTMWKYRDWLIQALNEDMPFDRFTIEQIAGDMLPNATPDQKIASGFHRNTMYNEEGGVDKDESYFEVLVDRVNTTANVWLGSTIGCAQCHDHKYDPFAQKDYYRLMAFFSSAAKKTVANGTESQKYEEPILELPTPAQDQKRSALKSRIDELETKLKTNTPELEREQELWEQRVLSASADWSTLAVDTVKATGGSALAIRPDGSILASGENPMVETYVLEGALRGLQITALRIEALPDPTLPRGGPGRDTYGNFVLTSVTMEVQDKHGWRPVPFGRKLADDGKVEDPKRKQLWMIDASRDDRRIPRQLVLIPKSTPNLKGAKRIRVSLQQKSELIGQNIGRFRLSVTADDDPTWIVKSRAKLRSIMETKQADRTQEDTRKLADFYRTIAPSLQGERNELKMLKEELDDLGIVTALVMGDAAGSERPSDFVRTRGVFSANAEKVMADIPGALGTLPSDRTVNRLALAEWLASRENPLTARVIVNRIWEQYFGRGIVETSEDFGSQGQRPTHPELLDWLAVEFMDRGWSMKAVHRLIVTSAAYRQRSDITPELLKIDPNNRLISRGPRFRLEAELIRDVVLAASGLLSDKVGGPSVFPQQPPGVWDLPYNDDQWEESTGPDKYRRGIYTFARRSAPYPAMFNFDSPSRELCTIRRIRTNTPLQALTTLNDAAFFEAAQALGRRILKEGGSTDATRIDLAFRLCTARAARHSEIDRLVRWREREREYFQQHIGEARKLAPESEDAPEQAAWTMLANVMLNLDETLTKE
jgi:hypothetical protein